MDVIVQSKAAKAGDQLISHGLSSWGLRPSPLSSDEWTTIRWVQKKIQIIKIYQHVERWNEPTWKGDGTQGEPIIHIRQHRRLLLDVHNFSLLKRAVGLAIDIIAKDGKITYWYSPLRLQFTTGERGCPECSAQIQSNCRPVRCLCGATAETVLLHEQPYSRGVQRMQGFP